jgi:hypothetical protein
MRADTQNCVIFPSFSRKNVVLIEKDIKKENSEIKPEIHRSRDDTYSITDIKHRGGLPCDRNPLTTRTLSNCVSNDRHYSDETKSPPALTIIGYRFVNLDIFVDLLIDLDNRILTRFEVTPFTSTCRVVKQKTKERR